MSQNAQKTYSGFSKKQLIVLVVTVSLSVIIVATSVLMYLSTGNRKFKSKVMALQNKSVKNNPILFLGDSLTEYLDVTRYYSDSQSKIITRGLAGLTSKELVDYVYDMALTLKPSMVILLIGANDLRKYDKPKIDDNIVEIVKKIKKKTEKVLVQSIYPVNEGYNLISKKMVKKSTNKKVDYFNKRIKERQIEGGYTYLEMNEILKDTQGKLSKHLTVDGLHINGKGYELIFKKIEKHLTF